MRKVPCSSQVEFFLLRVRRPLQAPALHNAPARPPHTLEKNILRVLFTGQNLSPDQMPMMAYNGHWSDPACSHLWVLRSGLPYGHYLPPHTYIHTYIHTYDRKERWIVWMAISQIRKEERRGLPLRHEPKFG